MYLEKLQLLNFKNYAEAELALSPHINCFLGNNGQGKTNLLDAIFYLAFCKSFFNPIDSQLIKSEEGFMTLQGDFNREKEKERIHVGVKKGQKKQLKRNKKVYEKLADHIGLIPLVMISPSDSLLIIEGSEIRRRFLDLIISQFNRQYLDQLIQYNKALSQRNRLLKKFMEIRRFDEASLEIWDEQLIKYGEPIFESREKFIADFLPLFQKHYDFISGNKEEVKLVYESQLKGNGFKEVLLEQREKDRRLTYTSVGIHKDDLSFEIEGKPLKKFGSQGQQKTYLLSLKLAQAEFLKNIKEIAPILLLDDIYDKLDEERVAKLMKIVQKDWFGQVFISDTHLNRLPDLFDKLNTDYKAFIIENGEVKMSKEKEAPLKELVDKMLRAYGLSDKLDEMSLVKSWEEIVGKMIAKHTVDIYFAKGTLYVKLDSAPLRQELSYAKSKLIERLNGKAGKQMVKDIQLK